MLTIAPPSASSHERESRPDARDHATHIDVEDAADERVIERIEIAMRHEARDPGRVDKQVEPGVTLVDRRDRVRQRGGVGHRHAQRHVPVAGQRAKHRFRLLADELYPTITAAPASASALQIAAPMPPVAAGYDSHTARERLRRHETRPLFGGLRAAMRDEGHEPPVAPRRPFRKLVLRQRRAALRSRPLDQFRRPGARIGS